MFCHSVLKDVFLAPHDGRLPPDNWLVESLVRLLSFFTLHLLTETFEAICVHLSLLKMSFTPLLNHVAAYNHKIIKIVQNTVVIQMCQMVLIQHHLFSINALLAHVSNSSTEEIELKIKSFLIQRVSMK